MVYVFKDYKENRDESTLYNDVNDGKIIVQLKHDKVKPENYGNNSKYDLIAIKTGETYTFNVRLFGSWPDVVVEGPLSLTQLNERWKIFILFDGPTGGKKTRRRKSKRRRQRKMRSRKSLL